MRTFAAQERDIVEGKVTDVYFERTMRVLKAMGLANLRVKMEVHSYGLPHGYQWAVFAGLEEALRLLEGRQLDVYAMPEGTLFREVEPVMIIEGPYEEMAIYETALLGVLRHSSSIATKAARIRLAATNKTLFFFGLRSAHPALAPVLDRAAYVGGVDSVSGVVSRDYFGLEPSGTMPHALVLAVGDNESAWKAFDEFVEPQVPRIMLVDTLEDERTEALKAARLLGKKLTGVRLDTPGSRRGNFRRIIEEVRWNLRINGHGHVKIFVSGGIDEEDILQLRDVVDGFGVGTSIAFPPSVDLSMDIVEKYVNGQWVKFTKRGKWPGAKQVYRCQGMQDHITLMEEKVEFQGCRPLLRQYMSAGKIIQSLPSLKEIRDYVISQLSQLELIK
ncbi:nicotinate phosphoribosyltransferase [Sulfodiicoccus acidiphilus]|uniref:nicotinate phosphoribosyltransferase n=1 Tax=Sulfodiicoccus acidiphilus TaxID=1670455 RepID=A0A348B2Z5_9CREN|nr:nicotinate phosphoribosyltransferase [Sulfodiicoccus acidiphilus]BBD72547.1 nicotinate phosphoribosyltransferase [Sulfodiicoccus acidiphilus]GGT93754.1 nicotinate phosphoribosyltransferase [Sulfodiicoccus acidiphilus]